MQAVRSGSNPPSLLPSLTGQTSATGEAAAAQLDLRTAQMAPLPVNHHVDLQNHVVYEVLSPQALADRILNGPPQPFWLWLYQDPRPRPLDEPPQRLLQIFSQANEVVAREENRETRCNSPQSRTVLIEFLIEQIGKPDRLYLSTLPRPNSRRREHSPEPELETRRLRRRLDVPPTSLSSREFANQSAPTFRHWPTLTRDQRRAVGLMPSLGSRQQSNAPGPSARQIQDLLAIDHKAFCHSFADFDMGVRALMLAQQANVGQGLRSRCERVLAALIRHAHDAVRHWSADVNSMGFLCRDCKGNTQSHQALLEVLADMLVHHPSTLNTRLMVVVANLLSHYSRHSANIDDGTVRAAVTEVAQQYLTIRQSLTNPKDLSLLANCFSKWPKVDRCAEALVLMAVDVCQGRLRLEAAKSQEVANLANAWSKCAEQPDCAAALVKLAADWCQGRLRLEAADPQALGNLANAWSKCAEQPNCAAALVKLAADWCGGRLRLEAAKPQEVTNLANAWSKCAEQPDCAAALVKLAADWCQGRLRLEAAAPQALANLANAWSKCAEQPDCAEALAQLAAHWCQGRLRLEAAAPQALGNLANAWSKCAEQADCAEALAQLAAHWCQGHLSLEAAKPQELANLANAWSKCAEQPDCAEALAQLAAHWRRGRLRLEGATPQHLANLANGWSKCAEQADCAAALAQLAADWCGGHLSLEAAKPQELANLANAWSKCAEQADCAEALAQLAADWCGGRLRLEAADPQALGNLANAWSKCAEQADCAAALAQLAAGWCGGRLCLEGADSQALANLANGWSKCAEQADCAAALTKLAAHWCRGRLSLEGAIPQHLVNLSNAWSKCAEQPDCRIAINQVAAQVLGEGQTADNDFSLRDWSKLALALARTHRAASAAEDSDTATESHGHLADLSLRLEESPAQFATASTQSLAILLRALGRAGLRDERRRLAPVMLKRLEQLRHETPVFPGASLETFGHLCIGLQPLAMQGQRKQRALRGQVLQALDWLQPTIAQALAQQSASVGDTRQSRHPAMSARHLLETYAVVAHTLRPRHLPRDQGDHYTAKALHARRQALKQWLTQEEARLRPLFESSDDVSLWNLQSQIQGSSTGLGGAMDRLLTARAGDWRTRQPSSVFDVRAVLTAMEHSPRTPRGDVGLYLPPRIDSAGRRLQQPGVARYHVLSHLTGGKLPFAMVEFGHAPTLAMLERPISFEGQTWRAELAGGSRMKKGQTRAKQVMKGEGERPGGPQLLALRVSETLPGSAYDDLARALMPAREDFFRFQRMFLSSPPEGIPGLKPLDHVLEGAFRIGILPDRIGVHSFRFNDAQGRPIALQPHDGCGFIRQSLLERLPACQKAWGKGDNGTSLQPLPAFATRDPGNLPGQALQHYPRSDAVAQEVNARLTQRLNKESMKGDGLFRAVATGLIQGHMAVAVPSADNRVHLSTTKAADFLKQGGGVLIGRSPYDKPNLRPFTEDRIATSDQSDPTAAFLDKCTTLQYSYVGDQRRANGGESALFASKGLMIGVPDNLWPDAQTDIVMSAQDIKTHSDWKTGKQRVTQDSRIQSRGLLVANEVFTPGSVIAMPRNEQQRLDGDFDGDTVVVIAGRPQLFEHVRQFDEHTPLPPVLKPPKTHSTPFDSKDDHYQHGRSREILPVYAGVMEQFSTLQTRCLAQPEAIRETIAARMLYGSFEGLPKGWKRKARALLDSDDAVDAQKLDQLRLELREQQQSAPAHRPAAQALEAELLRQLDALRTGNDTPAIALPESDEVPGMATLREDYQAAHTPLERIEVLLNGYPERQLSSRVGYENPGNAQQCLQNLLSLGIKAGTDAYKSQTGVYEFSVLGQRLDQLLRSHGTVVEAPYTKGTANRLAAKRFSVGNAQQALRDNPTLAASVMQASLAHPAVVQALEDQKPDSGPSSSDRQNARRLATELQARAQAHHGAVARILETALQQTGTGKLFDRAQECKGRDSMLDKILRRQQAHQATDPLQSAKNVNDALRFHVQLDEQRFVAQYQAIMTALDRNGTRRLRTRNCFILGDAARYKGINVTRTAAVNGETLPFEIQFHTARSREVKKRNHNLYKDAQKREMRSGHAERVEQLEETMRQRCKDVPAPPGVEQIGDSGGDWPEAGLWKNLATSALPDEPLSDEDDVGKEDEDSM